MKVYSIFDRVAKECGPLFTAKNDDVAVRNFNNLLVSERVCNHSDYMLYCLGEFDPEKPILEGFGVPTLINTNLEDDDE